MSNPACIFEELFMVIVLARAAKRPSVDYNTRAVSTFESLDLSFVLAAATPASRSILGLSADHSFSLHAFVAFRAYRSNFRIDRPLKMKG
jgi:hypothetical protein